MDGGSSCIGDGLCKDGDGCICKDGGGACICRDGGGGATTQDWAGGCAGGCAGGALVLSGGHDQELCCVAAL